MDRRYRDYRAELDDVLLNGSPQRLREFIIKYNRPLPANDEVLLLTWHKTITAAKTLPVAHRRASKVWLEAHGYHALDDGDL